MALVVKNPPANAGDIRDAGSIPGSGRFLGEGHSNALHYFCLEKSMDRGTWWATVHGVTQDRTQLKRLSTHSTQDTLKCGPQGRERVLFSGCEDRKRLSQTQSISFDKSGYLSLIYHVIDSHSIHNSLIVSLP